MLLIIHSFGLDGFKWRVFEVAYQHRLDEAVVSFGGPDVEDDVHRLSCDVDADVVFHGADDFVADAEDNLVWPPFHGIADEVLSRVFRLFPNRYAAASCRIFDFHVVDEMHIVSRFP